MTVCFKIITACEPYFVLHTAQTYRSIFKEGEKDLMFYSINRSRVQNGDVQLACPPSSNTALSHIPLPCVRCISSGTFLVL